MSGAILVSDGVFAVTSIAYLIRETAARGIRVHAEMIDSPAPEGARILRSTYRYAYGAASGEDGKAIAGSGEGDVEFLFPNLGGSMTPNGRPILWWRLERKTGEHVEQVWKGSKKSGSLVDITVTEWDDQWRLAAGDLADAMEAMWWVYEWAITGELCAPRSEWLACEVCDEAQMVDKGKGARTAKQKCHMTHNCSGIVRRLPPFLDVPAPKVLLAAKMKPTEKPVITPGAIRFKEKLARGEIDFDDADEEYVDDFADDLLDEAAA